MKTKSTACFFLLFFGFCISNVNAQYTFTLSPDSVHQGQNITTTITADADIWVGATVQNATYYLTKNWQFLLYPVTASFVFVNAHTIQLSWNFSSGVDIGMYKFILYNPHPVNANNEKVEGEDSQIEFTKHKSGSRKGCGGPCPLELIQDSAFKILSDCIIDGYAYNDLNFNNHKDAGEPVLPNIKFYTSPGNTIVQTDANGKYVVGVGYGQTKTIYYCQTNGWMSSLPTNYFKIFTVTSDLHNKNFAMRPDTTINSNGIYNTHGNPKCNTVCSFSQRIDNTGTMTFNNLKIYFVKPAGYSIYSYTTGGIISGDTILWKNITVTGGHFKKVNLKLNIPSGTAPFTIKTIYSYNNMQHGVYFSNTQTTVLTPTCAAGVKYEEIENNFINSEIEIKTLETTSQTNSSSEMNYLNAQYSNSELHLFPNPANNFISITTPGNIKNRSVLIFDLSGKQILKKVFDDNNYEPQVSLTDVTDGLYLICILSGNKILYRNKLSVIKQD